MRPGARVDAAHPARIAARRRDLAVEADGELGDDEGQAGSALLDIRLVDATRLRLALADVDGDSRLLQRQLTVAADVLIGIENRKTYLFDSRCDDRLRAGGGAPLVAAWLQRHVQRRPSGGRPGVFQRNDLRVRAARRLREPLAGDATVLDDDRAHGRVRARRAERLSREFEGALHVVDRLFS